MSTQLPAVHSVHFYDRDSDLISRLCSIVSTSLRLGDSALIVAEARHRDLLVRALKSVGIDVRSCVRDGRYTMLDAKEALSSFMLNGKPDPYLFQTAIGKTLDDVRQHAQSENRGLTVFGEMVAVLWDEGQQEAALALERLWNAALSDRTFHLHCAYPRALFSSAAEIAAVCDTHSHVLQ